MPPEEELGLQSPVSYEEDFEDLSSNADLYVFNDQMVQGYREVTFNTRENEEFLGEMHKKDYIDVSYQENTLGHNEEARLYVVCPVPGSRTHIFGTK